jgi:hypothetical protein
MKTTPKESPDGYIKNSISVPKVPAHLFLTEIPTLDKPKRVIFRRTENSFILIVQEGEEVVENIDLDTRYVRALGFWLLGDILK